MTIYKTKVLNIWNKDNNQIILLFFISILAVYYLPLLLNQLIFLVFLFLAYRSKKDYFWIAFFFILIDTPGRLFQGGELTDIQRTAFYPITSGVVLTFNELFIFIYLFKTFVKKRKYHFVFKNDFVFLLFYTFIVLIYSLILGMSTDIIIATYRILLPWSIIYIITKLFIKESDFDNFNRLLFPIVFLALISQAFSYLTGNYLSYFLKGVSFDSDSLMIGALAEKASRAADSSLILIYCFTQALFYLFSKRQVFSRIYLYLIISISVFSVFLSATRGWIIAFLFILLIVFITSRKSKNIKYIISIGVVVFIVIAMSSVFFPMVNVQIKNVTNRMNTIAALAEGDITAEGTLSRLDVRSPLVMNKFKESPIIGYGFSKEYFEHCDGHVGHQNILLNVGIIGYIILNFFYFKWCIRIYRFSGLQSTKLKYGQDAIRILCYALIAMYIIHSLSVQSWGWHIVTSKILFYSLLFAFFNIVYKHSVLSNKKLINE